MSQMDSRLAFEILHDVQESIIDVRMFDEPDLYLV